MAASSSSGSHLNAGAAAFIPKPKLLKDWYNMKEIMEQIRQKNMFWVTNPNQTKSLLPQIRRMIKGTFKKAYKRVMRNKHGNNVCLNSILVRDWDTILPLPNTTGNYLMEMQQFLIAIFTYTEESTPESIDFLSKASNLRDVNDFKLLYFHPLMQSTREKFHFPIQAFGYISSFDQINGVDWENLYSQWASRFTSDPLGVQGSILSLNNLPRTLTFIDGTTKSVVGFQELELIRRRDSKQYTVLYPHVYAAEELRFIINAKTHYNERCLKLHGGSLYIEDIEMVFATVFPKAALKVFEFFWESGMEIDFEGHFEITGLVEDMF